MSLKTFVLECDWPGCGSSREFAAAACLRDFSWAEEFTGISLARRHLCPEHRHKRFADIEKLTKACEGVPQL